MQPICLVMEFVTLLAQDLAGILDEIWPGANVIVTDSPGAALRAIEDVPRVDVSFVNASPYRFADSELAVGLAARGSRIILMGDEAEAASRRGACVALAAPFSTGEVSRALEQVGARTVPALRPDRPDPVK
jgi:hypothetical protein